jgi:hypothetical protein
MDASSFPHSTINGQFSFLGFQNFGIACLHKLHTYPGQTSVEFKVETQFRCPGPVLASEAREKSANDAGVKDQKCCNTIASLLRMHDRPPTLQPSKTSRTFSYSQHRISTGITTILVVKDCHPCRGVPQVLQCPRRTYIIIQSHAILLIRRTLADG